MRYGDIIQRNGTKYFVTKVGKKVIHGRKILSTGQPGYVTYSIPKDRKKGVMSLRR